MHFGAMEQPITEDRRAYFRSDRDLSDVLRTWIEDEDHKPLGVVTAISSEGWVEVDPTPWLERKGRQERSFRLPFVRFQPQDA